MSEENFNTILDTLKENDPKMVHIILDDFDLKLDHLKKIYEALKDNTCASRIIWPRTTESSPSFLDVKEKIRKKIKENIENYRRYPNDFVHALLSYHVYKDCRPSQEIELENYTQHLNEWKIHQVFTISKSGYYAAIYENSTTHNIVLAHRGTAPSLKQLFETDGPINTDSLLESPTSTASSTFRKVIKLLIPDAKVWAELTGSKVQLEYSNQVLAAFGLFFFSILK